MQCCCPQAAGAARFFSWFARRSGRRYRRRGLERSQRELVAAIEQAGVRGATVLEIGCGVGYLHQTLLTHGAARAVGVDLSDRMLEEARRLAAEQDLEARTSYRLGDFVALADEIETADVTILDKVVCCYPDPESLVNRSLDKTRRVYGLTYPRDHVLNRLVMAVAAFVLWALRIRFRGYVHDPRRIESWILARGFRKTSEVHTFIWLTQVYVR